MDIQPFESSGSFFNELQRNGLAPNEIARLLTLKLLYGRGRFRESTPDSERLEFYRWLYQEGRLNS